MRDHAAVGVGLRATRVLAVLVLLAPAPEIKACTFDCNSDLCGDPVNTTNWKFHAGPVCNLVWNDCVDSSGGTDGPREYKDAVAVDLRGRNITSIAQNGLFTCPFIPQHTGAHLSAILLDNNPLRVYPSSNSLWYQFVSMTNCSITELSSSAFFGSAT
jgi:hypothetical protein